MQHSTSKLDNVKRSVEKFLKDNLETTESLKIDYEAYPFESGATSITEWIQPRLLGFNDPPWQPKASSNTRGNVASVLLNTNCFVNRENITASDRHYVLRDTVNKYLYSGASIPLRDYAGGTTQPWVCRMYVAGIETDTPIPNDDLLQYNFTVRLQWVRQWED